MRYARKQIASLLLKLALPLGLGIAFAAALYIRFYSGLLRIEDRPAWPAYVAYFALSAALWSALETRFGIIYKCFDVSFVRWLWLLAQLDAVSMALVSSAAFFWRAYSFSRYTIAIFWGLHFIFCAAAAACARGWARRNAGRRSAWIFIVGDEPDLVELRRECLAGAVEAGGGRFPNIAEAARALREFDVPPECCEVVVAVSGSARGDLASLAEALEFLPAPSSIAIEKPRGAPLAGGVHLTRSFVVVSNAAGGQRAFDYVVFKRAIDLIISGAGLILLAPVMAALAVAIWLRSGRPIFLAQQRVGRGGRKFLLYKFRSLPAASLAESDREWISPATDAWGRFLRFTGLDELPQLFNVLRGDMSLVGPRPERPHFVEQFRRELPFYSTRHRLQVGITGWAQINGWRGDTSIRQRVEHDLYYLRHWSLGLDFRILWMTLADFLRRLWPRAVEARGTQDARSV